MINDCFNQPIVKITTKIDGDTVYVYKNECWIGQYDGITGNYKSYRADLCEGLYCGSERIAREFILESKENALIRLGYSPECAKEFA